jgi:uncharacterized membrane protein HdeD (DUF308 family)
MFGIGFPAIAIIFGISILIYGIIMTIDAIKRRPDQFLFGNKWVWVLILIVCNPLITKFLGGLIWLIGYAIFIITSIFYHILVRRKQKVISS